MIHKEPSELADKKVAFKNNKEIQILIEDWWDRVSGTSWMFSDGNPACIKYALRSAAADLPIDNEVLYGKIDGIGHLVHISELEA